VQPLRNVATVSIVLQPSRNGAVSTDAMHTHARTALAVLLAAVTLAFTAGAGAKPGQRPGARATNAAAQDDRPNDPAAEAEAAFERFQAVATEYVDSLDTVLIEAEDAVGTCERSPRNDAQSGGKPRFLEAQRARGAFAKQVDAFEKSVKAVATAAKPTMPVHRADAAKSLVRASATDLKALETITDYLSARGSDKHEEYAKARAKLTSLKTGALADVRATALRDIGIRTR
jgi:hypothetical protein